MSKVPLLGALSTQKTTVSHTHTAVMCAPLQGYLIHKKPPPRRTLQKGYGQGPVKVLGGAAVSCERGTPVHKLCLRRAASSGRYDCDHFVPSLDALSLRPDVIRPTKILSYDACIGPGVRR